MTRGSPRRGFTLLELLVVLAVFGVLASLLLPAVQKVRDRAARLHCVNHLKQIGLAIHNFHDQHASLPHGGTHTPPASAGSPDQRREWSWAYHILPYLGQESLYRAETCVVDSTPVPLYYCPKRRPPAAIADRAKIDYAGNAGTDEGLAGLDGVIIRGPTHRLRLSDITDGISSTLMIGEKQLDPNHYGVSPDDNEWYNRPGWNGDYETYRRGDTLPGRDLHCGAPASFAAFGSAHKWGFNAGFADGAVRHVRFSINAKVWERVCVRNDGQTFSFNEL